jgi:hypothetical protein
VRYIPLSPLNALFYIGGEKFIPENMTGPLKSLYLAIAEITVVT